MDLANLRPIRSDAAWTGPELRGRSDWIHPLTTAEIADIESAVATVRRLGLERSAITRDTVAMPALAPTIALWREELRAGRGFVLVRGLPVDRLSPDDAALAYWILGLHLGMPVPQNFDGELITDIRDSGADPSDPSTRLYKTRAEQDFHTDGADIIGLLCLRTARSGGLSRIVSSVSVYNDILRRRRDLVPTLFGDFYWHYYEPSMPAPTYFTRPICTFRGDGLNTFFIAWYIRRAQELREVPRFTDAQREAIEAVEQSANDPALYLDMEFQPGDIQLLKNSVILHKRTAYEDWPEPEQRRHLLRLWLAAPDFQDGDAQLRHGITQDAR